MNTKRDREIGGFSPASSKMSDMYGADYQDTIQAIKVSLVPTQIADMRQQDHRVNRFPAYQLKKPPASINDLDHIYVNR